MIDRLVSIIMPSFNAEKYIGFSIKSVLSQSYENWELIIVDDGSTDNTIDIIKSFSCSKLKLILLPKNTGKPSKVRNVAIQNSQGEYIAFLDADDLWEPNKLQLQFEHMLSNDLVLSFTALKHISVDGSITANISVIDKVGYLFEDQLKNYTISCMTVMLNRKRIGSEMLVFNENITIGEDYELFMKLLMNNKAGSLNISLSSRRVHPVSISNKMIYLAATDLKKVYFNLKSFDTKNEYNDAFHFLKMKIAYYEAKNYINDGDIKMAQKNICNFKFSDLRMFFLWLSLFFGEYVWNWLHKLNQKHK